jgi:predicted methyltransferase
MLMNKLVLGLAAAALLSTVAMAEATPSDDIAKAVADPLRPDAARALDAERKPAEVLAFAGVKAGDKVADVMPGAGYFTLLFSDVAGPKGHVYAVVPNEILKFGPRATDGINALAAQKKNVSLVTVPINDFKVDEKLDLVWTSQNYHDFHDKFMGPADVAKVNKAIFDALKPGGVYLVLDHAAEAGSGLRDTDTLHRIDPAAVKAEVTAAGFVFAGESKVLVNPADAHDKNVFDGAIRHHTDQFIYKFVKPKSAKP